MNARSMTTGRTPSTARVAAMRARREQTAGFGVIHPCDSPLIRAVANRAHYERLCKKFNVAEKHALEIAKLANLTGRFHTLKARAKKAEGDSKAGLIVALEEARANLELMEGRIHELVIPLAAKSRVDHNAISSPADVNRVTEVASDDRFARYRAVVKAKGAQVAFDKSLGSRGEQVCAFIESLKIPDGPKSGQPFALEDWQREAIIEIYDADVLRDDVLMMAVRQAVMTLARKNGKTSIAAALVLAHLIGPLCGWNQQIYSAAFDRDQAAIIFKAARSIVIMDDKLSELLTIQPTAKTITCAMTLSTYIAISAEARSKHGKNPSFVIFDELGQFGADRELFDVLQTSMGAQDEALMLVISTQAANDEAIMSQLVDYGRGDGANDPTFRLIEYSVPNDCEDIWNEATWKLANPALGTFRSLHEMRDFAMRARAIPSAERTFRNLYLNQRVAEAGAFISPIVWDSCATEATADELADAPCWIGIDLSSRLDLTAIVFVWRLADGQTFAVRPLFFTPADTMDERAKRDRVPYYDWAQTGKLEAVPGSALDFRFIAGRIAPIVFDLNVQAIVFDRWRFDVFKRELRDAGCTLDDDRFVPFGQGFRDMSPAVDTLEELLLNRRIMHAGHPVLRWNAGNCALEKDAAGNRKFTKSKSYGRIDGIVALAMALVVAGKGDAGEDGFDSFLASPVVIGR